jgi:hypothetical protein
MSAINGTNILLYSNGTAIAMQKSLSMSLNDALIDGTNKESNAWYECIPGLRDAKIEFNSLFSTGLMTDTPAVLSAKDLMDYILARNELLVVIADSGYPVIGKVNMDSLTFEAPVEGVMTLSGSFKVTGRLYCLIDESVQMITDPDGGGTDYDTMTVVALAITSAINASGGAYVRSNVISVADTGSYRFVTFLTVTSGELPSVMLYDNTSANISNVVVLAAGLNIVTLTCTATDTSASLRITNTAAANWKMSSMFLFKLV